jgi:large subunit ribosomal protein L30
VKITLRRSLIGVPKDQRATVYALGLKKTGDTRVVADTRDVAGMVNKVAYLLTIESAASEGQAPQ